MIEEKQCNRCNTIYPLSDFRARNKAKTKYRKECKYCSHKVIRDRMNRYRRVLHEYKASKGCSICGYNDYRALQFHHVDKSDKEYNVSEMIRNGLSINRVLKEVEKCIVLCGNCHLKLHFEEREIKWIY